MGTKHNKKRNVGLIYEFLCRKAGMAILEGDNKTLEDVKKFISGNFQPKKEITKELKIFRGLSDFCAQGREQALTQLERVKKLSKSINAKALNEEKTSLVHNINKKFGQEFFDKPIPTYKALASIQNLINMWSSSTINENILEEGMLEEIVVEHCMTNVQRLQETKNVLSMETSEVDNMVVALMLKKFEQKFQFLSETQREVLKAVASSKEQDNKTLNVLENIQAKFGIKVAAHTLKISGKEEGNKLTEIKVLGESVYKPSNTPDDDTISFWLDVAGIVDEMDK